MDDERIKFMEALAEKGSVLGQTMLARWYSEGSFPEHGYRQSYSWALRWWRKAAAQGCAEAHVEIGKCYFQGRGVPKDEIQGHHWFSLAATMGDVRAESYIAHCFQVGKPVKKDYAEAIKWYTLAADKGCDIAQNNLGSMYNHGEGVSKDLIVAYKWFNLSAGQGNELGLQNRDAIERIMTPDQIAEAQHLCRVWTPKPWFNN
jgi:TPR repeat protein